MIIIDDLFILFILFFSFIENTARITLTVFFFFYYSTVVASLKLRKYSFIIDK